jgi:hypothetical protein
MTQSWSFSPGAHISLYEKWRATVDEEGQYSFAVAL